MAHGMALFKVQSSKFKVVRAQQHQRARSSHAKLIWLPAMECRKKKADQTSCQAQAGIGHISARSELTHPCASLVAQLPS